MRKKSIYKVIILIVIFFITLSIFEINKHEKVVFMAVGQGDSSLIYTKDRTILIDGGPDWEVLLELSKILKYRMKINDIIITHPHSDHYFGLVEIINRYKVDNIYYSPINTGVSDYTDFLSIIKSKNINLIPVQRGDKISLRKDCYLHFLWPKKEEERGEEGDFDENELSIVNYFTCGQLKVLFTGDISGAVEKQLISMDKYLEFDVLKAAHHGSNKSNSWDFLKFYRPKIIVISAGKDNKYGLPSPEVISRAKRLNIKVENLIYGASHEILIK
jgi:competence protein ComEC